ncbi:FadR/GntR family transcriptional regulator [Nitrospirillum viridazoti]|uniref:GntR family transcriptional regulator n=1 Tax=Nitrospirillum viridazoti CBAmc TaxID=1441467 RepID=A0A248K484_9PROT|nr:FadR/GntR family transcriptional regulator [Nitrospirillum amazonense]ASG25258.1 GntR family transcriptional regulator [Nitrospirillum amazonense CBAmc]TWB35337.1 GntR family transcriptional regulator [Nitrospirillum amazonense]
MDELIAGLTRLGRGSPMGRLHGSLARKLGTDIVTGRYQPGDVLENEIVNAERLKVSRSAYREALRILAAKGLVESRPKSGTQVCARSRWNLLDPDVLAWHFAAEPSKDFIYSLFELRMIVEPGIAALAAERRTEEQLARMTAALDIMDRHTLAAEAGQAADADFHDTLLEASGNPLIGSLAVSIGAAVRWSTIHKLREGVVLRDPIPLHRYVLNAVAARDAEAARDAMRLLITEALRDTAQSFKA